ncbi:MAG: DNA polymerase III subunit gamma/tau [Bacteroidota bacterium]
MAYLSLYRRWRPQTFAQVVGQQHVVRTLQNALRTKHVAHAYLFAGPRGTGKTSIARLLAKGLNCAKGVTPEPCLECESCRRIADGTSLDCLEIDGASNRGIDEVRELRERSKFAPQEGPYKVYIIDEVHMLTTEAFNALLKTLEEPPEHVVFVLATTEAHKVPATILSRCQRFDFHRFGEELVAEHLARVCQAEGIQATPAALRLLARHAEGGMRDALSLLEQCVAYVDADTGADGSVGAGVVTGVDAAGVGAGVAAGTDGGAAAGTDVGTDADDAEAEAGADASSGAISARAIDEEAVAAVLGLVPEEIIERFYQALKGGDVAAALGNVEEVFASGADIRQFVHAFAVYLRELLLTTGGTGAEAGDLLRWIDLLADAEVQLRAGASPRFILDLTVLRLALGSPREVKPEKPAKSAERQLQAAAMASANRIAELEARLARLEEMLLGQTAPGPVGVVGSEVGSGRGQQGQGQGAALRSAMPAVTSFWQAAQLVQQQGQGSSQALGVGQDQGQAQVQAEAQAKPQPQTQVQPRPQVHFETGAQPRTGTPPRAQAQPEVQAQSEPAAEPAARAVAQPVAQAEAQPVGQATALAQGSQGSSIQAQPQVQEQAQACILGDELASTWDSVMGQVRQRSIQVHALLREARPAVLLDDTLHLVLPAGCAFHKSGLEQPKVLEMLERVVSRALRRATHLRFYLGELPADIQSVLRLDQGQLQPAEAAKEAPGREGGPADRPAAKPAAEPAAGPIAGPIAGPALGPAFEPLAQTANQPIDIPKVRVESEPDVRSDVQPDVEPDVEPEAQPAAQPVQPGVQTELQTGKWERADALLNHPLVKKTLELFGGQVVQVIPAERQPR